MLSTRDQPKAISDLSALEGGSVFSVGHVGSILIEKNAPT